MPSGQVFTHVPLSLYFVSEGHVTQPDAVSELHVAHVISHDTHVRLVVTKVCVGHVSAHEFSSTTRYNVGSVHEVQLVGEPVQVAQTVGSQDSMTPVSGSR